MTESWVLLEVILIWGKSLKFDGRKASFSLQAGSFADVAWTPRLSHWMLLCPQPKKSYRHVSGSGPSGGCRLGWRFSKHCMLDCDLLLLWGLFGSCCLCCYFLSYCWMERKARESRKAKVKAKWWSAVLDTETVRDHLSPHSEEELCHQKAETCPASSGGSVWIPSK